MTLIMGGRSRSLVRLVAVISIAAGASACSSMPGWVDPTNWIGDKQTADDDNSQAAADNGAQTPDLASVPDKPAPPSTADERKQVADSLSADKARAQYSADALRGGTEPSAAPPSTAPSPDEQGQAAPNPDSDQSSLDHSASTQDASADNSSPAAQPAPDASETSSATPAQPQPQQAAAAAPPPAPERQIASAENSPPVTSQVSTPSASMAATAPVAPGDQLGFKPSQAPPLDPSVAQFVAQPILARYQQTAALASAPGVGVAPSTGVGGVAPAKRRSRSTAGSRGSSANSVAMGGPETMSGAVVANFDSLQATGAAGPPAYASPQGLPPAAVVFFPHDTTALDAKAKSEIRAAAQTFQSHGGQGFVRVVGHSSSRTGNMPLAQHLQFIFQRSQTRATVVASELIRDGVPASKVLVEAVGDSQPVYYESMPQGEDGNRRAEIFM